MFRRLVSRALARAFSREFGCPCPSRPCTVAADTAVWLRSVLAGTATSPAHAQVCCPGMVSSLKGRGFRSLAKRSVRKDGSPPRLRCLYGATGNGEALCCDATFVSPLTRAGRPVPGAADALVAARRRKVARCPQLTRGGPQQLVVLAAEVGGRCSNECQQFLRTYSGFVSNAPHHPRAPPQARAGGAAGGVCCRLPCSEPSPAPRLESGPGLRSFQRWDTLCGRKKARKKLSVAQVPGFPLRAFSSH